MFQDPFATFGTKTIRDMSYEPYSLDKVGAAAGARWRIKEVLDNNPLSMFYPLMSAQGFGGSEGHAALVTRKC